MVRKNQSKQTEIICRLRMKINVIEFHSINLKKHSISTTYVGNQILITNLRIVQFFKLSVKYIPSITIFFS